MTKSTIYVALGAAGGAFLLCHAFIPVLLIGAGAAVIGGPDLWDKIKG